MFHKGKWNSLFGPLESGPSNIVTRNCYEPRSRTDLNGNLKGKFQKTGTIRPLTFFASNASGSLRHDRDRRERAKQFYSPATRTDVAAGEVVDVARSYRAPGVDTIVRHHRRQNPSNYHQTGVHLVPALLCHRLPMDLTNSRCSQPRL